MKVMSAFILLVTTAQAQQISTQLTFPLTSQSVNGSSATGHCTGATRLSDRYQCNDPTSSVVYDGHIPTLTGLEGNMWASQLLTIHSNSATLVFDFTWTPNFQARRVEMVVFNCPQWGISVQSVLLTIYVLTNSALTQLGAANPTLSSCDSLVRVCIPNLSITSSRAVLRLEFTTLEPTDWIHIAEVGFYGNSDTCQPESFIPEPTTATTYETTTEEDIIKTSTTATTTQIGEITIATTTSSSTSTTLASAITTALLATLIFVLMIIALCKCHLKFKAESAVLAEGKKLAVSDHIDRSKGDVAVDLKAEKYFTDMSEDGVAIRDSTYITMENMIGQSVGGVAISDPAYVNIKAEKNLVDGSEKGVAVSDPTYMNIEAEDGNEGGAAVSDPTYMNIEAEDGNEGGVAVSDPTYVNIKAKKKLVDGSERGVAVSDPTYMNIKAEEVVIDLEKNEAYFIVSYS